MPEHTNRLIHETSPYLLQHAHNPVDWFPWGAEAFAAARQQDKLIFISIGYSTCYWCHVMERESFENEAIATVMNELFINIKIDREERPDVDEIYMAATQAITGRGGWPMSVWLEPKKLRPVYAGTYFPIKPRHGLPSFVELMQRIAEAWQQQREAMDESAEKIANVVEERLASTEGSVAIGRKNAELAVTQLLSIYDSEHGGFGNAPKFPQPVYLELLLGARQPVDASTRNQIDTALQHTLDRMAMGGMYDQIGGGFHRYSTDAKWQVPHFEKMLYDNGQLASVYAHAAELYDDDYYRDITYEILTYVQREMTDASGAFYSAQDAEVNAREGQNYLWTKEQIDKVLEFAGRNELLGFANYVYGLNSGTNFQDPHQANEPASNVLFLRERPEQLVDDQNINSEYVDEFLRDTKRILYQHRQLRDQPGLDDKVITSWNGLMIAGFADGGRVLNNKKYIQSAIDASNFIMSEMRQDDGRLYRTYRNGQSKVDAFLEDYAGMIRGLLALYQATNDKQWLEHSLDLLQVADQMFWDERHGGYFDTQAAQPDLFVRSKSSYDGAIPSGNGIMAINLVTLYKVEKNPETGSRLEKTLAGLSRMIDTAPVATALSTLAVLQTAIEFPTLLPKHDAVQDQVSQSRPTLQDGPVTVEASAAKIVVSDEVSEVLDLAFTIEDGYHINAHEPGDDSLIGLLIDIRDAEGFVVEAAYPVGDVFGHSEQGEIRVHSGTLTIPVRVIPLGDTAGAPRLEITWQACTNTSCLAPVTRVIDVEIEVASDR